VGGARTLDQLDAVCHVQDNSLSLLSVNSLCVCVCVSVGGVLEVTGLGSGKHSVLLQ